MAVLSGVRRGFLCTRPLRNSKMSIAAIICHKISSRSLRKLWNVIVGCHNCNCNVHLSQYTIGNARSPPKRSTLPISAQFGTLCSLLTDLYKQMLTYSSRNFCVRLWQCSTSARRYILNQTLRGNWFGFVAKDEPTWKYIKLSSEPRNELQAQSILTKTQLKSTLKAHYTIRRWGLMQFIPRHNGAYRLSNLHISWFKTFLGRLQKSKETSNKV